MVVTDADITGSDDVLLTNVGNVYVGANTSAAPMSMKASAYSGKVRRFGNTANDTLIGSPHADRLVGYDGNDVLKGLGGDDIVWGRRGEDVYRGGPGFDRCDNDRRQRDLLRGQGAAVPDVAVLASLRPAVSFGRPARRDARKGTR